MAKKSKVKKVKQQPAAAAQNAEPAVIVKNKEAEFPAFWLALIIPVICLVGAWTYPPIATPMELKSYASQIYLSFIFLLWFWLHRNKKTAVLTFSPVRVAFGLLFIAGTLSLVWAANPDFWVYKWNKWYAGMIMFVLGLHITQSEKNLDTVINLVILGGLGVALIGIGQYLFGLDIVPQTAFPSSTFGNGNMAGQIMVLTAMLPLYFLFKENLETGRTWYYAITMSLLLTYLFFTRTRAVWLAMGLEIFLVSLFILLDFRKRHEWLHWNTEKTKAGAAAILLFAVLVNFNQDGFVPFWEIAIYELSSISTAVASTAEQSGGERYLIWGITIDMIKDSPFIGTGLGSFFDNVNNSDNQAFRVIGVQRAHNDLLEIMVELGLLGLLLILGIIVTMCITLYKLILRSEGKNRILFALLTIAVTGSMLNAQLSFPYQLPVPLVIMPFYMALIIKGSENIEGNTVSLSLKPWFNKGALAVTAMLFTLISINDLLWLWDIHSLNRVISGKQAGAWKPVNPIFNQAYITGTRSVAEALQGRGQEQLILNAVTPILEYWPNVTANSALAAQTYMAMGNLPQAEIWIERTIKNQRPDYYLGEFMKMQLLQQKNDLAGLQELYDRLKTEPEETLSKIQNTYNMLHTMSINLQDYGMTEYYYEKFVQYHGEFPPTVGNQAIYYINTGNMQAAIPFMRRAIELDPRMQYAGEFQQLIDQYSAE